MAQVALEERIARLEGKVDGFEHHFAALHEQMGGLQAQLNGLQSQIDGLRSQILAVDAKVDRFREELSGQIERNFRWTTGINVALWSSILVAIFFRT